MSITVERSILLPGETLLWQGQDTRIANRQYPRYYLTDERLLVQTSRISFKGFDLSHIAYIEFEHKKNRSLITLTLDQSEVSSLVIRTGNEGKEIFDLITRARSQAHQKAITNGEQVPQVSFVKGRDYFIYNFIRQNCVVVFYSIMALTAVWASQSPFGLVGLALFLAFLLFVTGRPGQRLIDRLDQHLKRIFLKVEGSQKPVVTRRVANLTGNIILAFWCFGFLLLFLVIMVSYPYIFL
jgi:hypothetical protein